MSLLAATAPLAAAVPLAGSDSGKGSPIGLFVVLLLVVATYLLYRSMSGHLRRLPEKFPGYQAGGPDATAEPAEPTELDATTDEGAESGGPAGESGKRTQPS